MPGMKEEQLEAFVDKRRQYNRLTRDDWNTKSDPSQPRIDIAYWFWVDKDCYRIHEISSTLEEVVEKCMKWEEKILTEHKEKKDAPSKKK